MPSAHYTTRLMWRKEGVRMGRRRRKRGRRQITFVGRRRRRQSVCLLLLFLRGAAGCVQRACDEVEKEEEEEEEEGRAKEHSLRAVLGPIVAIPSSSSCFSHSVGLQGRSFSAPSLLLRIGQTESEQSVSLYPPRERKTCRSTETEKKEEWENYCWHRRGRETEDERRVSRKVWEMRGGGHWATAKCLR